MSLLISSVFTYDEDAGNYIQAVETADAQALEPATRKAINNFVIGCKQDGIWSAIKASCILAGARTLAGALVPLVGAAPTNNNFVSGDYNRKTGLVGDGSTKYLNTNYLYVTANRDNAHLSCYVSSEGSNNLRCFIGSNFQAGGARAAIARGNGVFYRALNGTFDTFGGPTGPTFTLARNISTSIEVSYGPALLMSANTSNGVASNPFNVFKGNNSGSGEWPTNARIAFYSVGDYLTGTLLNARVTDLINAFGAAIP